MGVNKILTNLNKMGSQSRSKGFQTENGLKNSLRKWRERQFFEFLADVLSGRIEALPFKGSD